ncbi:MAG: hypothetical protein ACI4TD_05880 [Phocaeicola sp.]
MRNPKNSWDKMDSFFYKGSDETRRYDLATHDYNLAMQLAENGPVHAKYRRMLEVWATITAPQFWWYEFDTYKVGTVRNSCSKMHKIHVSPFTIGNFSHEGVSEISWAVGAFRSYIQYLEWLREDFNETQDKKYWRALIEMLPSGYNMKATVMLNYEVLANIYTWRKNHKLDEWHTFCHWIEELPYSEIITGDLSVPRE